MVTAFTFVVWVGCVAIGATGLVSQPTPSPSPPTSQPMTQVVNVSLESEPAPPDAAPAAAAAPQPKPSEAVAAPSVPTVAMPSPAIAFAVPVAGPARVGSAVPVVRRSAPSVRHLSSGSTGGDRLPQPTYPYDAEVAGQTGTVVVRFTVGVDGHVTNVRVVSPCRWPLLNEAAARAALDTPQPAGVEHEDEYTPTFR